MIYKDFYNDVLGDNLSSLYIFSGEEYYLIKLMIEKLKEQVVLSEIDYYYSDDKFVEYKDLYSAVSLFPFISTRRIVVVNNADYIFSSKWTDKQRDSFLRYHDKNDTLTSILIVNKLDLRKKSVKTAKNIGKFVSFGRLEGDDYKNFIVKSLNAMGYKIKSDALRTYIKNSDYLLKDSKMNLFQVIKDLEVITSSCNDNVVDIHDVKLFINSTLDNNLWKWRESVILGDIKFAITEMNKLVKSGQHPILLCYMVSRLLSEMLNIKLLSNAGYSTKEIADMTKSKEFAIRNAIKLVKSIGDKSIIKMLKIVLEADDNMKVGGVDHELALENMIFKLGNF